MRYSSSSLSLTLLAFSRTLVQGLKGFYVSPKNQTLPQSSANILFRIKAFGHQYIIIVCYFATKLKENTGK